MVARPGTTLLRMALSSVQPTRRTELATTLATRLTTRTNCPGHRATAGEAIGFMATQTLAGLNSPASLSLADACRGLPDVSALDYTRDRYKNGYRARMRYPLVSTPPGMGAHRRRIIAQGASFLRVTEQAVKSDRCPITNPVGSGSGPSAHCRPGPDGLGRHPDDPQEAAAECTFASRR